MIGQILKTITKQNKKNIT